MRATADYRSTVLGNLLQRFWMESQGIQGASLEDIAIVEAHTSATSGAAA
jgi:xanthine dehydrogenase small subunit